MAANDVLHAVATPSPAEQYSLYLYFLTDDAPRYAYVPSAWFQYWLQYAQAQTTEVPPTIDTTEIAILLRDAETPTLKAGILAGPDCQTIPIDAWYYFLTWYAALGRYLKGSDRVQHYIHHSSALAARPAPLTL